MGIEGGFNNEVQNQEINQANNEQNEINQAEHQRSGEELEGNSTIDNEGERKQIEGKDDATESAEAGLDKEDIIEDDPNTEHPSESDNVDPEQQLDNQNAIGLDILGDSEIGEDNNEFVDLVGYDDKIEDSDRLDDNQASTEGDIQDSLATEDLLNDDEKLEKLEGDESTEDGNDVDDADSDKDSEDSEGYSDEDIAKRNDETTDDNALGHDLEKEQAVVENKEAAEQTEYGAENSVEKQNKSADESRIKEDDKKNDASSIDVNNNIEPRGDAGTSDNPSRNQNNLERSNNPDNHLRPFEGGGPSEPLEKEFGEEQVNVASLGGEVRWVKSVDIKKQLDEIGRADLSAKVDEAIDKLKAGDSKASEEFVSAMREEGKLLVKNEATTDCGNVLLNLVDENVKALKIETQEYNGLEQEKSDWVEGGKYGLESAEAESLRLDKEDNIEDAPNTEQSLESENPESGTLTQGYSNFADGMSPEDKARYIASNEKAFFNELSERASVAGMSDTQIAEAFEAMKNGDYAKMATYFDTSSPVDGAVFWSGNKEVAAAYANSIGGTIMEQTPGGQVFDNWRGLSGMYPEWDTPTNLAQKPIWDALSSQYANGTEGIATYAHPDGYVGKVWSNIEKPILEENDIIIREVIIDAK